MSLVLHLADSPELLNSARTLLREYASYLNQSLGEEHICLASYEQELASLPGPYAEPAGAILLALVDEDLAGCVALKALKPSRTAWVGEAACELKRLWVRPPFRGRSVGAALVEEAIVRARRRGYTAMYLDTVPAAMRSANALYRRLRFQAVERYNANPALGIDATVDVEFFRLSL